jgi:glutaredoxin
VVLYEKPDCGLCAEAFRALTRLALDVPIEIVRVDVERDEALRDRYALRVPVVIIDEREIDVAGMSERDLRRRLGF